MLASSLHFCFSSKSHFLLCFGVARPSFRGDSSRLVELFFYVIAQWLCGTLFQILLGFFLANLLLLCSLVSSLFFLQIPLGFFLFLLFLDVIPIIWDFCPTFKTLLLILTWLSRPLDVCLYLVSILLLHWYFLIFIKDLLQLLVNSIGFFGNSITFRPCSWVTSWNLPQSVTNTVETRLGHWTAPYWKLAHYLLPNWAWLGLHLVYTHRCA